MRFLATVLFAILAVTATPAHADLRVDITRGNVEPMPIAIPAMIGAGAQESQIGAQIASVVNADLERSGLFKPIPASA